MKIWHDNSGIGEKASWFLKFIIVRDLQTREKFYFLCQKWLAVEKGDGQLERNLFVASDWQKKEIKYLFEKQARHYIMDNHLWFSVFYRPIQSSFTRFGRVTCCFLFHYMSMFFNIIFYGIFFDSTSLAQSSNNNIDLTLFKISLPQVILNY